MRSFAFEHGSPVPQRRARRSLTAKELEILKPVIEALARMTAKRALGRGSVRRAASGGRGPRLAGGRRLRRPRHLGRRARQPPRREAGCWAHARRKFFELAGSDRGGQRAAAMYSLIATAKLNDVDPQAWLADVLARINDLPTDRINELLPWNWDPAHGPAKTAA